MRTENRLDCDVSNSEINVVFLSPGSYFDLNVSALMVVVIDTGFLADYLSFVLFDYSTCTVPNVIVSLLPDDLFYYIIFGFLKD